MYNAIGGLGGSGQLDSTVAANATVALLSATAASAITIVPPIFDVSVPIKLKWAKFTPFSQLLGPRACLLIGRSILSRRGRS